MELKPGYKQRRWEGFLRIGVLLELMTSPRRSQGITQLRRTHLQERGRPFLRSQNIGWGDLLLDDVRYR